MAYRSFQHLFMIVVVNLRMRFLAPLNSSPRCFCYCRPRNAAAHAASATSWKTHRFQHGPNYLLVWKGGWDLITFQQTSSNSLDSFEGKSAGTFLYICKTQIVKSMVSWFPVKMFPKNPNKTHPGWFSFPSRSWFPLPSTKHWGSGRCVQCLAHFHHPEPPAANYL